MLNLQNLFGEGDVLVIFSCEREGCGRSIALGEREAMPKSSGDNELKCECGSVLVSDGVMVYSPDTEHWH